MLARDSTSLNVAVPMKEESRCQYEQQYADDHVPASYGKLGGIEFVTEPLDRIFETPVGIFILVPRLGAYL